MNAPSIPLPVLIASLKAIKQQEASIAEQRMAIESQILTHYPEKVEGSITDKENCINIVYGLTRKVDSNVLQSVWGSLSENLQKAFVWEAKVAVRTIKALQEFDPKGYAQICNFITSTPRKPTITLKEPKEPKD